MKDLREFIDALECDPADEVVHVERDVNPAAFDCVAILEKLEAQGRRPLVVFDSPLSVKGDPSGIPVVMNAFATRERCATALGHPREDSNLGLSLEFARLAGRGREPTVIERSEAPVRDIVVEVDEVDMGCLPIVIHSEGDYAPCLTMTLVVRDPESGAHNLSFIKAFYDFENQRRLRVTIQSPDTKRALDWHEARGLKMPVAAVLGHHPAFYFGTMGFTPYDTDDYATIGGYVGEPVRLVPSQSLGGDFMVPADAEIVVEGFVPPGERMICDPFGDITRQYQAQTLRPIMNVTAMTRRSDAMLQDVFAGHRDHMTLGQIPKEGSMYNNLRRQFGDLIGAVHLPFSGCGRLVAYISIDKQYEGQAKAVAMAALRESWTLQYVVVVDSDIDVFNEEDVIWATLVYVDPTRDVTVIDNVWTIFTLAMGHRKTMIDATRPHDRLLPEMNRIPREALERIDLDEYLGSLPWTKSS
jgi:UbiD family decarboxylase